MSTCACIHCGEPERVEILEVYADGTFQLATCCEGMHEAAAEFLAEDPKAAARWISSLGHDGDDTPILPALQPAGLRRVINVDGQLLLDYQLEVIPVSWAQAREFIAQHHEHCAAPVGWRFGAAVRNGHQVIGVITVGNPVARAFAGRGVVEVNRLCVRRDIASGLAWNACSLLYGWAAREAKRRGFWRVITYTLNSEPGITLRAAGWSVDVQVPARRTGWDTATRRRDASRTPNVGKTRWARELRAPAARQVQ
jgi:hypothetical protein